MVNVGKKLQFVMSASRTVAGRKSWGLWDASLGGFDGPIGQGSTVDNNCALSSRFMFKGLTSE